MYIHTQWWPKLLEHLTDLKILTFFASKTLFNFIMLMKHADGCSEHNKYQVKWVILFLSTFNFNIGYVHLLQLQNYKIQLQNCNYKITKFSNYSSNTNKTSTLMLCLLQLKTKAFLWMYNRSVQFIFQLAPNLLSGVEVRTLRGPVHNFQCSSRFLPSQVVPAIVYFMGIVMTNSTKTTETSWLCQVF